MPYDITEWQTHSLGPHNTLMRVWQPQHGGQHNHQATFRHGHEWVSSCCALYQLKWLSHSGLAMTSQQLLRFVPAEVVQALRLGSG